MDPSIWTKQVWEERTLEFNCEDSLATGDSLASISGITVWEGTTEKTLTMLSGAGSILLNKVYVKIIGGADGHTYFVRIRLITTNGDKIEDDLKILVRNIGG